MSEYKGYSAYKETNSANEGGIGWELISVVGGVRQNVEWRTSYNNGGSENVAGPPQTYVELRYIWGRKQDVLLEDMQKQLEEREAVIRGAVKVEKECKEKLVNTTEEIARQTVLRDRLVKELADALEAANQAVKTKLQYEKDIAKIRQAIGDLRMREILT